MPSRPEHRQALLARNDDPGREILLTGGFVLTMDPALGDLVGDVHLVGDRVERVGPGLAAGVGADAVVLDVTGCIVLPGLIDSHVHAWEGQLRGIGPEADFAGYVSLVKDGISQLMSPEDVAVAQRVTAWQALNGGVTTLVDNSHNSRSRDHSSAAVEALLGTGVRAVHAACTPDAGQHEGQLPQDLLRLRDEYACDLLELRVFQPTPTVDWWRFAAEHGFGVCAELGMWVPDLDALVASGLMGEQHTYNHCVGLGPGVWRAIADSGAAVNLVPRSDSYFGFGGFVPVLEANRHGIQEGISADNEVSYGYDLFTEMRTLLTVQRGLSFAAAYAGEPAVPDRYGPRDVLRAATVGGSLNAGQPDRIGSLAPGKQADVVVLDLDTVHTRPFGNLAATVVSWANVANVDTVLVGGRVRKFGGELVGVDYPALAAAAEASRDRLLGAFGTSLEEIRFGPAPAG